MTTHWWENFFHGVALDFWRAAISDQQTRAEADFINNQLQLPVGAKVLDVPCGNGRLAKTMSSRVMLSIQIAAKSRVVTLSGDVTYSGTKRLAAKLAAQVKCVSRVINKIKVVPVTEECDTGQQNCCCPESGCECVPGRTCPSCGTPPATKQP